MIRGSDNQKDRISAGVTKLILVLLFLLGAALFLTGRKGQKTFEASGFNSGDAYEAIYALSRDVSEAWNKRLEPRLALLPEEEREALEHCALEMLSADWEARETGAGAEAEKIVAEAGAEAGEKTWKLLYTTYLVGGPKVSSAAKKELLAGQKASEEFDLQLLSCIIDESAEIPGKARKAAGKLEGAELRAMLMQAFFTVNGSTEQPGAGHAAQLIKSVRNRGQQIGAFRMIADGEMSRAMQYIAGKGRTVMLAGILLMLDALILAGLMAAEKRWAFDLKWIVILLLLDFLLFFQLLPLIFIGVKALFPNGSFSLDTLRRLYTYPLNLEALKNTVIAASATMVFGTAIAFPLAWLVGRTNLYGKKFFRSLFVITYMVPPYVGAMAWLRLMNPNVGTVNQWLRLLFHLSNAPGPLNVYTLPGMIWVLTTFYYPYAFITISRAMEKMDPSLEEASRISGASPLKTVFTVTLPLMMPSLIAGALLVFVSAASCYGIPSIIGIPGNVNTVTTRITEYVTLGQQGFNDAIALSLFLLIVALVILFVSDIVLAKRQYITVSGKSVSPAVVHLRSWRIPLTVLVSLFAVVVILLPFVTILTTSFKVDIGKTILAPGNFTLANWSSVFARNETIGCLKNSLLFASAAATGGLLIAIVMSYLLQRTKVRGRTLPSFLITLGSGTPSVVIALGLIMTMRGNFGVNIYGTMYIMIIAYMIKYMMMGMRTVVSAMSQVHVSLEECSQVSGAGWLRTMMKITGPLIFPSIAAGWFLIFIPSFYELSMTTLLYSSTTKTIGFQLYEYWTFTSQPMSCAMAFGILLIVVLLNFVLGKLTKGGFSI